MANIAKKETITIGPPGRCVRMTSPYRVKDHCYNPWKYVRTITSDLGSDPMGVRIPQTQDAWEERCNTNCRGDVVWFSGIKPWKRVPKQEFIIKSRRGWGGGWRTQRQFLEISKKMDFHTYVNKEITFVRSNDIMWYAREKHTQLNIGWQVHPKYGWVARTMLEWWLNEQKN